MSGLPNQRARSFAQAVSYNGNRDYEHVERFLASARKYKEIKKLSDFDAVRSLKFILKGDAANWWQGVEDEIITWREFESELRKEFAPTKPAYIIYSEIGQLKQLPGEFTERFVAKHRALFNQLRDPPREEVQLDMMYGNLLPNIQELIPRECIETFDGLLEAARIIDQQIAKDAAAQAKAGTEVRTGKKRTRCGFCRMFGHVAEVCRKKQRVMAENAANATKSAMETEPVSEEPAPSTGSTSAVSVDVPEKATSSIALDIRPRPMIEISIGTAREMAFVDTGAKTSVASFKLFSYLKNIGFHFQEENTVITLADGKPRSQNILTGRIPVKVKDRCVLTKFVVLPEARDNDTLLGVEFIIDARIILNLPQLAWNFEDEPDVHYELIEEST